MSTAPPEKREVFSKEMRRVGAEGSKVLRLLADKLKLMVKLSPGDILYGVHEAAEQLQQKIDKRSYLLVDAESWEIGNRRAPVKCQDDSSDMMESEPYYHWGKSLSETVLDIGTMDFSKNWDTRYTIQPHEPVRNPQTLPAEKLVSWPSRGSFSYDGTHCLEESKTYQSASALSLATFASLLIEFVARLQNLVDAFEELSEKANFKEPVEEPATEPRGFWARLARWL